VALLIRRGPGLATDPDYAPSRSQQQPVAHEARDDACSLPAAA